MRPRRPKQYCLQLVIYIYIYIIRGRAGYELIYITNEAVSRVGYYQLKSCASSKNNCLVNFQVILMISSGETSANRDVFFTEDAAKNFFPTSKISAQEICNLFFLIWSNLTIMAHIIGLGKPIRKLENLYPELKIYHIYIYIYIYIWEKKTNKLQVHP